jgi:hypothetical protein
LVVTCNAEVFRREAGSSATVTGFCTLFETFAPAAR